MKHTSNSTIKQRVWTSEVDSNRTQNPKFEYEIEVYNRVLQPSNYLNFEGSQRLSSSRLLLFPTSRLWIYES